jgi:molybdopterin converting factor subunit 1
MRVKLLFFATLRDRAGTKSAEIEIPDNTTVRALKTQVAQDYPGLSASMGTMLISINHEYAFEDALIPANAEIALFPPVSGGSLDSKNRG